MLLELLDNAGDLMLYIAMVRPSSAGRRYVTAMFWVPTGRPADRADATAAAIYRV